MRKKITAENNFHYFTLSLVILLLASACIKYVPDGLAALFLKSLVIGTVIVAYLSLDFGVFWRRSMIALLGILVLLNAVDEALHLPYIQVLNLGFTALFFTAAAGLAGRRVLLSGVVNSNTIVGSLAIYLLLGLIWATIYLLVLEFIPGAFNGMVYKPWAQNFETALYFSYVTMTSLGYGDISPASAVSRTLAYFEAISGTFYLAIVVASLVGARSHRSPGQ